MYFCDPRSPWQRGRNENTNRLLRQYLPDGTDLSTYSQVELNAIARKLNTRPRKTLSFMMPIDKLAESLRPVELTIPFFSIHPRAENYLHDERLESIHVQLRKIAKNKREFQRRSGSQVVVSGLA